MGQELNCRMRRDGRWLAGKAYLETDHVLFRGDERFKIALKDLRSVRASAGLLRLEFEGGPAEFELGKAAEKWAAKILHPPARADKLGVKPGLSARLEGDFDFDAAFRGELASGGVEYGKESADLVFFAARQNADLSKVKKLIARMKPEGALWVVYPKGGGSIREVEVIAAGRAAGLKDVKVASFSSTHTALKFVVPVAAR